jgi:hypothetical protein
MAAIRVSRWINVEANVPKIGICIRLNVKVFFIERLWLSDQDFLKMEKNDDIL